MKRTINKVAVLGSGAMGSQIACHFANIGVEVLLLDIVPKELTEKEQKKGITKDSAAFRNRIADDNLQKTIKSKFPPLFKNSYKERIETGNFEDHMEKVAEADWILEAVIEKLDIKHQLFEKVEQHRTKGTIMSSNTSGLPMQSLVEGRSEDFQKHFCGTHFFNPPRYLELLELIPCEQTLPEIKDFLKEYADRYLGKTPVVCKDTPAFIGNRIGVYGIMLTLKLMQETGLSVEEVDTITGKPIGRPKTATFRTADMAGIDILAEVAKGIHERCPEDEERELFQLPSFLQNMLENGQTGEKAGKGFYKKEKQDDGSSVIYALDLDNETYRPEKKPKFALLEGIRKLGSVAEQLRAFDKGHTEAGSFFKKLWLKITGSNDGKAVTFFRKMFYRLFAYCSNRIPEIGDQVYQIDRAMRAGFGWTYGPFETWDVLGFQETLKKVKAEGEKEGFKVAPWVEKMAENGVESFYKTLNGYRYYYDINEEDYRLLPGTEDLVSLDDIRSEKTVWSNKGVNLIDLGDGILNAEITSRGGTLNMDVIDGLNKAADLAEKEYKGLVIGNEAADFSYGADLKMIGWSAYKKQFSKIRDAVNKFQQTMLRLRYSTVPVVAAPRGRALGGGTELCMHTDSVQASAETYMGLVEIGVGLIPAGGGTKEFVQRAAEEYVEGDPPSPVLQEKLMTIGKGDVAMSAPQGYTMGYLREGTDRFTMNKNRLLTEAKKRAGELAANGYMPPHKPEIRVLGYNTLSYFYSAIQNMYRGNYITDYEWLISRSLAFVMCGGDLSGEQKVSEEYLLKLERQTFLSLVGQKKTLERMQHIAKTGKPLRN